MKKEIKYCKTIYKNLIKYEGILIILLIILLPTTYTIWLSLSLILQFLLITLWWFAIKFKMVSKIKDRYPGAIKNIYITENFDFAVYRFELNDKDKDLIKLRKKAKDITACVLYSILPVIIFTVAWIIKFIVEMT